MLRQKLFFNLNDFTFIFCDSLVTASTSGSSSQRPALTAILVFFLFINL